MRVERRWTVQQNNKGRDSRFTRNAIFVLRLEHFFRDETLTIMSIAILRLTASMKTSNSSRQRIGHPMASHRESRRQIVEKDFSPPEREVGSLRLLLPEAWVVFGSSVWTCENSVVNRIRRRGGGLGFGFRTGTMPLVESKRKEKRERRTGIQTSRIYFKEHTLSLSFWPLWSKLNFPLYPRCWRWNAKSIFARAAMRVRKSAHLKRRASSEFLRASIGQGFAKRAEDNHSETRVQSEISVRGTFSERKRFTTHHSQTVHVIEFFLRIVETLGEGLHVSNDDFEIGLTTVWVGKKGENASRSVDWSARALSNAPSDLPSSVPFRRLFQSRFLLDKHERQSSWR